MQSLETTVASDHPQSVRVHLTCLRHEPMYSCLYQLGYAGICFPREDLNLPLTPETPFHISSSWSALCDVGSLFAVPLLRFGTVRQGLSTLLRLLPDSVGYILNSLPSNLRAADDGERVRNLGSGSTDIHLKALYFFLDISSRDLSTSFAFPLHMV